MELNEQYKVEFVDIDYEGRGVCKLENNFPIFVPDALKGERALIEITDLKKNFGSGRVIRFYEKSPLRKNPPCPFYGECGGCNLMHLDYQTSLDFKTSLVKETLKRIANVVVPVNRCVGMKNEFQYRNKLEFHFSFHNQKIRAGFYNEKSHKVVDINKCLVEPDIALEIITFLKSIFKIEGIPIYKEKDKRGCIRHVIIRMNQKKEVMVIFVTNTNYLKKEEVIVPKLVAKFPSIKSVMLSFQPANDNVHIGEYSKLLFGKPYLEEDLLGLKFQISPESFFQINHDQTEHLYQKVLDYAKLSGKENVIDAYCGIGTISLFLAKKAHHVYGIEIVKEAVDNANNNKKINKIDNATFIYGPCEEKINELVEKKNIDLIVCDPPRKGMERSFIDAVGKMGIPRMIYVSCNVRTMARDLVYLREYGYEAIEVSTFDMFPNTTHVESVVTLSLRNSKE